MFDVETALENVKLAILDRLEVWIFFALHKTMMGCQLGNFFEENLPVFYQN